MITRTALIVGVGVLAGCTAPIGGGGDNGQGTGAASGVTGVGGGTGVGGSTGIGGSAGVSGDPTSCVPGVPQTTQLPRLTRVQYDNTIRDLIGLDTQPSSMLAPDSVGSMDQRAWDGFRAAAEELSAQALVDPTSRAKILTCATADDACAQQIVSELGQRAFRRPLSAGEHARLLALYTNRAELTANDTFDEAIQVIVKALLMSPSFITRAEIVEQPEGAYFALSGYEVASRLSYMLWASMPDDELFAAAAAGTLSTPQGILAEAQRMLGDPRARANVGAFHREYAHMGAGTRWSEISRDPSVYPAFSADQVPLLSAETERFFEYVVFEQEGTFQDLMTAPVGFVNASLAPLYDLDPARYGADLEPVDLDPTTRSGLLTRLGFLTSHSSFNRTSPILRGAFIQKEVLCNDIGTPPPDAEGTPLPTEGLTTNRERVDAQTSAAPCARCHHVFINPTGFALEAYDAIGKLQTMDNGAPINTAASVPVGENLVDVTGPVELMSAIANSPEAHQCYAQKWVQYAYQREINPADSCTAAGLASKLTQGGYTVLNLVADLTQSDSFRYRATSEVAP